MPSARIDASIGNLEVFCRTFELGNFTRAAVDLGLTPQAASRALARLEAHVGTTLFRRTTRNLEPTEAGRAYYTRARQALDLLVSGSRELAGSAGDERGTIRISAGTPWGHHKLLPALAAFARTHPNIELVVQIDNRNIDFVRDGYDLAIRLGEIRDQTLIARKLGNLAVGFDALIEHARLVITGEGSYDAQSSMGKVTGEVIARAGAAGVPVLLVAGRVEGAVPPHVIVAGSATGTPLRSEDLREHAARLAGGVLA
jgi:hypothetical protein